MLHSWWTFLFWFLWLVFFDLGSWANQHGLFLNSLKTLSVLMTYYSAFRLIFLLLVVSDFWERIKGGGGGVLWCQMVKIIISFLVWGLGFGVWGLGFGVWGV